jgi:hypothetical protein
MPEFEWCDFALQSPSAMSESLAAAGVDAALPERDGGTGPEEPD